MTDVPRTDQLLFIQGISTKVEGTEEATSMNFFFFFFAGNNYRWVGFQRNWENLSSVQAEVESAKMLYNWWGYKYVWSRKGLVEQMYRACENVAI